MIICQQFVTSVPALTLLALLLSGFWAAPAEAQRNRQPAKPPVVDWMPATVEVEARLLRKSPMPGKEQLAVYQDALTVYEYQITKVLRGEAPGQRLQVTHWVVKDNLPQAAANTAVGSSVRLKLHPFEELLGLHEVYRSDTIMDLEAPVFHDVGQQLVLAGIPGDRWNYGSEISQKMPVFFRLKDQLRLVVLGDCQAAMAHRAELYMGAANKETPTAFNLCQERACLNFQKALVETYFDDLPKLEWVLFSWNPRLVNGSWKTHGLRHGQLITSPGFRYDQQVNDWSTPNRSTVRVQDLLGDSEVARLWRDRPWGWRPTPTKTGFWTNPQGQMRSAAKLEGTYRFSNERWQAFGALTKKLMARNVKMLVFIPPYHPDTADRPVKDKDGVTEKDYLEQVAMMQRVEKAFPGRFFFYDLNQMGRQTVLAVEDFGDVDHPNDTGARKLTEHLEQYRLKLEARSLTRR